MAVYLGFLLLVTLSPIFLAINMNRRRIRLLGLYTPVVFTLCMLKVIESNIRLPESGSLEASLLMFFFGFPLIIGSLIFTLIRLRFVYSEKLWKGMLIFLSYICSHYFDDSGFLSTSYLSLLFRPRSVGLS